MKNLINKLNELNACKEAINWLKVQQTPEQAWNDCERGDWLIWLIAQTVDDRKRLVTTTCECVRLIWDILPDIGKNAIEVAESWIRGEATLEEVKHAAYVAYAVAGVAADAVAAYAVVAAVADAAAGVAARKSILQQQANIIRKNYTFDEIAKGLNNNE